MIDQISRIKDRDIRDGLGNCYDCAFYAMCYELQGIEDLIEIADAELLRCSVSDVRCEFFASVEDESYINERKLLDDIEEKRYEFREEWFRYLEESGEY